MKPLAGGGSRLYSHESVAHRDTEARMTFARDPGRDQGENTHQAAG